MNQRIKTKNLAEELLSASQQYIDELSNYSEVVGIIITGGLARGFVDRFSDIDIEVFLYGTDFEIWERESPIELNRRVGDHEVEIEFFNYEEFSDSSYDYILWTMENRWDKSHSKIVYDPYKKIVNLINSKVVFRKGELKDSLTRTHKYAYWFGNIVAESWLQRGDVVSAAGSINNALENLVDFLFLLNSEFIPHKKWKYFYVKELNRLPRDFAERFDAIYLAKTDTTKNICSRIRSFNELLKDTEIISTLDIK
jgi:predicted nucleotidyltransferase